MIVELCKNCQTLLAVHGEYCQFCEESVHSIEGKIVTGEDIGSPVTYIPPHADGDASHPDCERGVISSYNESYIFVRFNSPNGQACSPDRLRWG
jgi:hypothetical protein